MFRFFFLIFNGKLMDIPLWVFLHPFQFCVFHRSLKLHCDSVLYWTIVINQESFVNLTYITYKCETLTETQHHSWWYKGTLYCKENQRKYHKCEILLIPWLFCVSFFTCKVVLSDIMRNCWRSETCHAYSELYPTLRIIPLMCVFKVQSELIFDQHRKALQGLKSDYNSNIHSCVCLWHETHPYYPGSISNLIPFGYSRQF